jgi:pyruvate dehydrogenase E1 component alpha subunit
MPLSHEQALDAYRRMRTIREFEEAVNVEFSHGHIPGFVHLYAGEEACGVAVCMHLDDRDYIISTHRGHGHCIAKGCNVKAMMLEVFGKAGGLCAGKGGSMHIADLQRGMLGANAIVGANGPLALGAALSAKLLGTGQVSVSFTGDGASNQGSTFEAMNMAVALQLPVVFVVENNGYGGSTGASFAVGSRDIAGRAAGFGLPVSVVDGTDFFAVHEAAGNAIERARSGGGPSLVEARLTRFYGHFCGDAQAYRSKDELAGVRKTADPLTIFRARVLRDNLLTESEMDAIDKQAREQIEAAVAAAKAAPAPAISELTTDVYISY